MSVPLTNTGERAGKEVVQLYLRDLVASTTRPVKELKGFEKVSLEPGARKTVTFNLATEQLAFYDKDMNLIVEPGEFEVMVGSSSEDIRLEDEFEVVGEVKEVGYARTYFAEVEEL